MLARISVIAIAAGALMAFLVGCGESEAERKEAEDTSTSTVSEAEHAHGGPRIGQKAPTFALANVDGNEVNLADMVGKKTLAVVFWGTWCDFCKAEIPTLKKLQEDHAARSFQIVSVAVKKDPAQPSGEFRKDVSDFVKERKLSYTVLLDPEYEAVGLYHLHGVPTIIVVDLEGSVRYTGHSAQEAEQVVSRLLTD